MICKRLRCEEYTSVEGIRPMKNYLKFGLLIAAVLGTLAWLAVGGISETKTYYKTVAELKQLGDQAQ